MKIGFGLEDVGERAKLYGAKCLEVQKAIENENNKNKSMKFLFGDIVVVDDFLIGVVVKSWRSSMRGNYYEVYVRNYNCIKEYDEKDIERYKVRHKELNEEEYYYQNC